MLKRNRFLLPTILVLMLNVPCSARNEIASNQGVAGDPSQKIARIQSKLQSTAEAGLIDTDASAQFQQTIDEIRAQEDDLRTRGALNYSASNELVKKVDDLEAQLDKAVKEAASKPKSSSE